MKDGLHRAIEVLENALDHDAHNAGLQDGMEHAIELLEEELEQYE